MQRVAAVVLSLVLGACTKGQTDIGGAPGQRCTQIGCVDGLRVEMRPASGWAPGSYAFAVDLDGVKVTCTGALPLRACEAGPSLTCDVADKVVIGESGCALPKEQHAFSDLWVQSGPQKVEIVISRDGQELKREALTPAYTESRPNGPDCGPVCRSASATLTLP